MGLGMMIGIAVGLAMDAFAVSVAAGIVLQGRYTSNGLRLGMSFGLFQMVMPLLGWRAGMGIAEALAHVDHWIAFGILSGIGLKMIYEAFQLQHVDRDVYHVSSGALLLLSIATSIDAFAVGMSLAFLNVDIFWPALITGCVTFCMSFAGVFIGKHFGHLFEQKIEIIAGIILILIGFRILIMHVF